MASTRNINARENYKIEQRTFDLANTYNFTPHSAHGLAKETMMPGFGLNPAQIPRTELAHNPINIESYLFGINSTNLVKPHVYENPDVKSLQSVCFIDRLQLVMPTPLVIEKDQRPLRK